LQISYFSPLSPLKSGISEYSEKELLPSLKKYCDLEIVIDKGYKPTNNFIVENFKVFSYEKFQDEYDLNLYHMGNNPFHIYAYEMALEKPGVVILHDAFIHHLVRRMTLGRRESSGYAKIIQSLLGQKGSDKIKNSLSNKNSSLVKFPLVEKFLRRITMSKNDRAGYIKMMEYCLGPKGKEIAKNAIATRDFPLFEYPLVKKLADSSIAIIVHSNFAKKTILKECPNAFVKKINQAVTIPPRFENNLREELKVPKGAIVIGSFGYVQFTKRYDVILRAFSEYIKRNPNAVFLIGGSFLNHEYENELDELIEQLGLSNKVIKTGYVDDLFPYVEITDIVVQLRYPTAGETSTITLKAMGFGKPVIVSNVGSFSELPEDVVIKLDVNSNEEESLTNAFMKLTDDKEYRDKLSSSSYNYVKEEHDPDNIAFEIIDFLSYLKNPHWKKYLKNFSSKLQNMCINNEDTIYLNHISNNLNEISEHFTTDSAEVAEKIPTLQANYPLKHNLKDDDILYYLHIPKTAGSSLISIIDRYFPRKNVLGIHAWKYLLPKMPLDFKKYQFVRGHFGYGFYRILPKKPVYITILREPKDLVISSYKMIQRQPFEAKRYSIPQDKTISELITDPKISGLKNIQTHYIGVDLDVLSHAKGMTPEELADYQPEEYTYFRSPKMSDEKLVDIAKKHLSDFAFIGIMEKMEESLILLHFTFGWKPIRNKVRKNVAPNQDPEYLSDEAKRNLQEWTKCDQELYTYGQQLFDSRYSQMVEYLEENYYEQRFSNMHPNDAIFEMLTKHYEKQIEKSKYTPSVSDKIKNSLPYPKISPVTFNKLNIVKHRYNQYQRKFVTLLNSKRDDD